ncbi:hypothetical protein PANO111632_06240 [Paracoccus nototheniae]
MGAGVQPGKAAPHAFDRQHAIMQIAFQQGGDLQLSAIRGLDRAGAFGRGAVEEIEAGDGIVRRGNLGFLDDRAGAHLIVEIHHAIAFRVRDAITKDRPAAVATVGGCQQFRQPVTKEDVVAQHHRGWRPVQKILGQDIGLCEPVGRGLDDPGEVDPPLAAIAQQALELGLILGRGDDGDLADAGQHQHGDRIIDHRLVIQRQQLFRHAHGDRIQPRARSPGQNDTLTRRHGLSFS